MQRSLLTAIAQLPEDEQDEAIDSLVDAILAEGLTEEEIERLRLADDDADDLPGQPGRPN